MAKLPKQETIAFTPYDLKANEKIEDSRLDRKHKDDAFRWVLLQNKLFTGVILLALLFAILWAGYSLFWVPTQAERALTFLTGLFGGVFGKQVADAKTPKHPK